MGVVSIQEDLQEKLDDAGLAISPFVTPKVPLCQKNDERQYVEPHRWDAPEKQFVPIGTTSKPRSNRPQYFDYQRFYYYYSQTSYPEPSYAERQARERLAKEKAGSQDDALKMTRGAEKIKCQHCSKYIMRREMSRHVLSEHPRRTGKQYRRK